MSPHNLCFEQKYEKYQNFLSVNFPFVVVKFSIYLNRRVVVYNDCKSDASLDQQGKSGIVYYRRLQ